MRSWASGWAGELGAPPGQTHRHSAKCRAGLRRQQEAAGVRLFLQGSRSSSCQPPGRHSWLCASTTLCLQQASFSWPAPGSAIGSQGLQCGSSTAVMKNTRTPLPRAQDTHLQPLPQRESMASLIFYQSQTSSKSVGLPKPPSPTYTSAGATHRL